MKMRKIKGKICRNESIHLYHISEDNHNRKIFKPRIPASILDTENGTIARICFSTSMSGAFRAIGFWDGGWSYPYYVHVPENIDKSVKNNKVIIPCEDLVPDQKITNEYWVRDKVKLKCIGLACFKFGEYAFDRSRRKVKIKWIEKY
jgi:hypothetical protein